MSQETTCDASDVNAECLNFMFEAIFTSWIHTLL